MAVLISKAQFPALLSRRSPRTAIVFAKIKPIIIPVICMAMFLACAGLRLLNLSSIEEVRRFSDTSQYTEKATWPLWSWGQHTGPLGGIAKWWLQGRSPTVPLFYKMAGNAPRNIALLQLSFSILSWGLLALLVSRAVQFSWLKPFAFLIILLFSLSDHIIMWDAAMLSDSISLSLLALFIASWLWLLENWHWRKAALMLVVAFLWVFSRDTNGWVVLMLAVLLLLIASLWRSRRCVLIASIFVLFFIANEVSQSYSHRWVTPFFNVITQRILPNAQSTAFFAQLGMPVTAALMQRSGQLAWSQNWSLFSDPAFQDFRDWGYNRGKSSYARFLLAHPAMTLQEPLRNIEVLMAPKLTAKSSYYWSKSFSPILTGFIAEVIYFQRFALLWMLAAWLLVGFGFVFALREREPKWLIALTLIMLTFPHLAIVWHGDSNDIGRHALQAGVHFRIGLWLLILFACDRILLQKNHATARKHKRA
jgi:hypothetical protein